MYIQPRLLERAENTPRYCLVLCEGFASKPQIYCKVCFYILSVDFVSLLDHNAPGRKNTRTLETGDKMRDNIGLTSKTNGITSDKF